MDIRPFEDATFVALLYASPRTASVLSAFANTVHEMVTAISEDPAESESESWQKAMGEALAEGEPR